MRSIWQTFQRTLTNFTFGEKFANLNELYNGYERTEQLWIKATIRERAENGVEKPRQIIVNSTAGVSLEAAHLLRAFVVAILSSRICRRDLDVAFLSALFCRRACICLSRNCRVTRSYVGCLRSPVISFTWYLCTFVENCFWEIKMSMPNKDV